jgi:hypothetical protein
LKKRKAPSPNYFNQVMNKTNFISCLFILNVFVCLARLDSGLCMAADHSPALTKAVIELVVSENPSYNITGYRTTSTPAQSPEFSSDGAALSSINKFSLSDYNAFVLQLLKSSNKSQTCSLRLMAMLQKCCVWHQSSSDIPPLAV